MSDNILPFNDPPTYTNEMGVKWWLDGSTTSYATSPDPHGTTLPDVTAWIVQRPEGDATRILLGVVNNEMAVIYTDKTLEGIACHIDMLKADKRFPKN